jgi:hypothetical protein
LHCAGGLALAVFGLSFLVLIRLVCLFGLIRIGLKNILIS